MRSQQRLGRRVCRVVVTVVLISFFGELGNKPGFSSVEAANTKSERASSTVTEEVPEEEEKQERKRQRQKRKQERQEQYDEYLKNMDENHRNGTGEKGATGAAAAALDASAVFGSVFPNKKPRHILEGFKNAVTSVLIGSTIGGLSFFIMPVAGWYHSSAANAGGAGWSGLFVGGLAGAISGATVTLVGVVNAGYQVITSVYTTFSAIAAAWQGTRVWDEAAEAWVVYDLKTEIDEISAAGNNNNNSKDRKVRDMGYYDLLQVPSHASAKEIKKAYYRQAKELHPDKNPGNDEAAEQFRHLHTVYRILSDDDKRATYDAWGEKSVDDNESAFSQFDPFTFFAVLFGSQLVETYIGELAMPSILNQLMKLNPSNLSSEDIANNMLLNGSDYHRRKRELDISVNLLERVKDFVDGTLSKEAFRESCTTEAENIAGNPFGEEFLIAIGSTLAWEAGQYLGWTNGSYYFTRKQIRRLFYTASSARKAVSFIMSAYEAFREGTELDGTTNFNPEMYAQEQAEEMLPEMLDLAWSFILMDISSTLNGVCRRLFADAGADSPTRKKRAKAIQILGKEFMKRGKSNDDSANIQNSSCKATERDAEHIKARLEVAFQASLMKVSSVSLNCFSLDRRVCFAIATSRYY
jgi:curved DNA-binding protein CbpA